MDENSVDGILMEWIEDDIGKSQITSFISKKESPVSSVELSKDVPLPNMRSVAKAMTAVDSDKIQKYTENMRRLIITARRQIGELKEQNQKLQRQAESDYIVRCPSCDHCHKKKVNRFLPTFIKAYPSRFALELTFESKENLFWFMEASQLEADKNGIPVLAPTVKIPPKSLAESGSKLSKLVEEAKKIAREPERVERTEPRNSPRKKERVQDSEYGPSSSRSFVQTERWDKRETGRMSQRREEDSQLRRGRTIVEKTRTETDNGRTRKDKRRKEDAEDDTLCSRSKVISRRESKRTHPSSRYEPPPKRQHESNRAEEEKRISRENYRRRSEELNKFENENRGCKRSGTKRRSKENLKELEKKELRKDKMVDNPAAGFPVSNQPEQTVDGLDNDEYALVDEDDIEASMTETRSEEKPAVEEDLSHFGEIVNDDEDVFGENCESDTEDSFH